MSELLYNDHHICIVKVKINYVIAIELGLLKIRNCWTGYTFEF